MSNLETLIQKELEKNQTLNEILEIDGVFVAGGFVRDIVTGEESKDIDLFFEHQNAANEALRYFSHIGGSSWVESYKKHDVVYQLVMKDFTSMKDRIDGFDFHCVRGAFNKKQFAVANNFLTDCSNKKVDINVITKPLSSLNRLQRYVKNNWDCSEAYYYILDVMKDKDLRICLMGDYYES